MACLDGSVCEACGEDTGCGDIQFVGKPILMYLCIDCRAIAAIPRGRGLSFWIPSTFGPFTQEDSLKMT